MPGSNPVHIIITLPLLFLALFLVSPIVGGIVAKAMSMNWILGALAAFVGPFWLCFLYEVLEHMYPDIIHFVPETSSRNTWVGFELAGYVTLMGFVGALAVLVPIRIVQHRGQRTP